jgi:ligand-binding SRPBCC domain-containing protein
MPLIEIKTVLNSDIKTCFDLARNIDLHQKSLKYSKEKAIAGKTSGLIELGEWVSWEAKHLGFVQHLTSKITEFEAPNYFVDEMVFGAFKSFRHEHHFRESENKTIMTDKFFFESPYGLIGKFVNVLFLKRYMRKLLVTRNQFLKEIAETV